MKVRNLVITAMLAAVICVLAPWAFAVGPIPITLATFAVMLTCAVGGWKRGVTALLVYILLGVVGVPVFSGFGSGVYKLIGPTGGYLAGYIPLGLIVGIAADKWGKKIWVYPIAMVLGTLILYAFGTAWYMVYMAGEGTKVSLAAACGACVFPFLPGDAVKIVLVTFSAPFIRKGLRKYL